MVFIIELFILGSTIFSLANSRAIEIVLPEEDIPQETNAEKFTRSDANHDDKLTFDEFLHTELVYELMKKDEFDQFDKNHDGIVSRAEYENRFSEQEEKYDLLKAQYYGKLYEDFDKNFDMKLSEEEVRQILSERFLLQPRKNFSKIFAHFDTNNDGGLDIEEYVKFDENVPFEEMDPITNNVPTVTLKKEKLPMMKKSQINNNSKLS